MIYLFLYLLAGIIFGWNWYFKDVKHGAGVSEWTFFLILIAVWPFPLLTEVILKFTRF